MVKPVRGPSPAAGFAKWFLPGMAAVLLATHREWHLNRTRRSLAQLRLGLLLLAQEPRNRECQGRHHFVSVARSCPPWPSEPDQSPRPSRLLRKSQEHLLALNPGG